MEKKITISNSFHNTSVNIMIPGQWGTDEALDNLQRMALLSGSSAKKYARVRRTLCGIEGCKCQGMWRVEEVGA